MCFVACFFTMIDTQQRHIVNDPAEPYYEQQSRKNRRKTTYYVKIWMLLCYSNIELRLIEDAVNLS